jgi:D-Tyr-tRNAtyr deacylase
MNPFPPIDEESEVNDYESACRPYYLALEQMLSRKHNLTVLDKEGKRISNGTSINEIYAQNYIYTRFTKIANEPTSHRPSFVAAALTECATSDFPYSAQLLSFHTDMLCELLSGTDVFVWLS